MSERKFSGAGEQASTKGSAHPSAVNAGRSGNTGGSGGAGAIKLASGGADAAAARKFSGTEAHDAAPRHLNAKHSGPKKATGADAVPSGVCKFGGKSV